MGLAFFDLDKTLIANSSPVAFAHAMRHQGILSKRTIARLALANAKYLRRSGPEESMKLARLGLELAEGWNQQDVQRVVEENLESVIKPIVFPEAKTLLQDHRDRGDYLVIVSSSPDDVVKPIGQYLGVDLSIASRPILDSRGCYTNKLAFFSYGTLKVEAMQAVATEHDFDLSDATAYSDSITDLPMLQAVGHPVVVNPDEDLAREALRRGWPVKTFSLKS